MRTPADILLRHVEVVCPGEVLSDASVHIQNGVIISVAQGVPHCTDDTNILDCRGQYLLPGFIDMHTHGALGADMMARSSEALEQYLLFQAQWGVTTVLPTTTAAPKEEISSFLSFLREAQGAELPGARIAGAHLEGPYLNPVLRGMHPEPYCRVFDETEYRTWIESGVVRRITAALELPGAESFLRWCTEAKILVSLGHTICTAADVKHWSTQGLRHVTHLYNAMSRAEKAGPVRVCGCLEGALLADRVSCEIIADGNHVPEELFRIALRMKEPDRITVCSDSTPATGIAHEGNEILYGGIVGGRMVVRQGRAVSTDGQTLVGSICPLGAMLPRLLEWTDRNWVGVARMLSTNASRLLGLEDTLGLIAAGRVADLVLANGTGGILQTWVNGKSHMPASDPA